MKMFSKILILATVALMAAAPAFACHTNPVEPPVEEEIFAGSLNPMAISLAVNDDGAATLYAINSFETCTHYNLQFSQGEDIWTDLNPMVWWSTKAVYIFNELAPGGIDLNLRLSDESGVVSNAAEVTFHSMQGQVDGYDWYRWVELNWLDENGESINADTTLSASLPWNDPGMIGMAAVPIPGTALLLSMGLLCLIGRRSNRR